MTSAASSLAETVLPERAALPTDARPGQWDTELVVMRGEDRTDLCRAIQSLQEFVRDQSEVSLLDLAYSLNSELKPAGSRLAIVARNTDELQSRLASARERLADPKRKQIKDAVGIYYFEEPLYPQGGLAFLFPGEGAQYLNMLSDLCPHFPEVAQCFAEADRLAAQGERFGGRRAFSRVFLVPASAGSEEKAEAEKALRELDNAMFSVLMADWAMYQLLLQLGLKPWAMAGHSMGELAALWAAGWMEGSAILLDNIVAAMNDLLAHEKTGKPAEAVLLAVGAGNSIVGKIIQEKAGTKAFLAMDNCPHQCVVVGLPGPMAAIEAELQSRRILCERLAFNRPYHTPLFEPYLGPLKELFQSIPFQAAATPIYSCSTGRPFPADEAEIRRLAVWHYATPVEFTRMIDNMYADGVRLFVESGPRGNLTAFVEDILRGRAHAALASNLPRRSGITQLHHLAGQLAAHHVPLNLDHFYCRRNPKPIRVGCVAGPPSLSAPQQQIDGAAAGHSGNSVGCVAGPPIPSSFQQRIDGPATHPTGHSRAAVVRQYLNTMDQFLDTQQSVMEAYLARRRPSLTRRARVPPVATGLPMIGEIIRHQPGREIVMRRRLDLAEDHFAGHHTVGGRSVSKVDPGQCGLPVMPMTFTVEIAVEVAALLVPGHVVVGVEGIRLFRWLAFDEVDPTSIEVVGRLVADARPEAGVSARVAVEVRDLGAASAPAGSRGAVALCTVLLGPNYPEPPEVLDLPLTNEQTARISLEVLYKNLFHGSLFQGTCVGGRVGEEGIEKEIFVPPREELLRSHPDPNFLADPVLLDVAMHPLAAWHLEKPDQSGRILLPIEVAKIDLFGPRPPAGARFLSRGLILETSVRHFVHQVDIIGSERKLWGRINRVKYWRFYVPFAKVNFHGPKDEYFISTEWPAVLPDAPPPASCIRLDIPVDQAQAGMRLVTARVTLDPGELKEFHALKGRERRQTEWLFGRNAAKDAVRRLWHVRHGERLFPADIVIAAGPHGRPIAQPRGAPGPEPLPTISIAHTEGVAAALAVFGPYAGIDLERVRPREPGFVEMAFDSDEQQLLQRLRVDRDQWLTRFWCAKEAVAKAVGHGLLDGPKGLSVGAADPHSGIVHVVLGAGLAAACPELDSASLVVQTTREKDLIVAVTFCQKAAS
ncbi:MAG TPA: 4'-phosphopantetheinyl transferase superfamily protein [Gemmataceae bacterium]|nr:4'-phosphopantetheinyl transferase superfamily protein [Gemmataceae bacterium]